MSSVETTKVQHNPNILKYRNNQRYLITLSVPIARSGLIASGASFLAFEGLFTVFFVFGVLGRARGTLGDPGGSLGGPRGSSGGPWGVFGGPSGVLGGPWGVSGVLGGSLGGP